MRIFRNQPQLRNDKSTSVSFSRYRDRNALIIERMEMFFDTLNRKIGVYYNFLRVSDREHIVREYHNKFGVYPNLDSPQKFTEILQRYRLTKRIEITSTCVDKYKVREYTKDRIGDKYLVPLIQVTHDPDQLNYADFPEKFIIKPNHWTGFNKIVLNKYALSEKEKKQISLDLKRILKRNLYLEKRQWPYKNVEPVVVVEQLLTDINGSLPVDYKFYCFHGTVEFIQVLENIANNERVSNGCYSKQWDSLPFRIADKRFNRSLQAPSNLEQMIHVAEVLSSDFEFVRIDLYNIDGQIYFGEFTFYPMNGMIRFEPPEYDYFYGNKLSV